ncbi:RILP-like protein 1 [Schistosoma japonicum]|nr:RILP-like protein 1 [Schistosoma japonicum]
MPKVISVLEELEDFATKFESEGREIVALQTAVHRLELEKLERKEDHKRHKRELEQIEETWHSEVQELSQLIEKLREENKQLKNAIEDKETSTNYSPIPSNFTNSANVEEIQLMIRLKEIIDRQKLLIRSLRQQLTQKHVDLDAMQQQATRLAKLNAALRRKHFVSKQQADQLREEKLTLETQLNKKDQQIKQIQECVHDNNTSDNVTESSICTDMSKSLIAELISPETPLVKRLNTEDKMIIDSRDPNRPHFTFQELRNVLVERNKLKSRLIEVEEELSVYKRAGDEGPPVQGPINREPDDKLYPNSRPNLGVKKL